MIMMRNGIVSVGNWIVDTIKFIDKYPTKGNLVTIRRIEEGLGGCAHNVLVDLAKLKSGIPLYAGGCVGNDRLGNMAMKAIADNGIDGATRTFFHYRGANAELTPEMVLQTDCPAKIFHLGYLLLLDKLDVADPEYGIVAARVLDHLQQMGYKTSVDVVSEEGDRFRQIILPCLKYTDYLIINEVEACCGIALRSEDGAILWDKVKEAAAGLLEAGIRELCVIHFPEGGVAVAKDGRASARKSAMIPSSEIVSSVGAGDAFCAGSLYPIHEGYELDAMLDFAIASARFNLSNPTSTGGAPTLEMINEYLKK